MIRNEKWHREQRLREIDKELDVLLYFPNKKKKDKLYKELNQLRNAK